MPEFRLKIETKEKEVSQVLNCERFELPYPYEDKDRDNVLILDLEQAKELQAVLKQLILTAGKPKQPKMSI